MSKFDFNSISRIHVERAILVVHVLMLALERQRQADPWGLLASQPHLLSEFQDSEALSKEEAASARDNGQVLLQHPHTHTAAHVKCPLTKQGHKMV